MLTEIARTWQTSLAGIAGGTLVYLKDAGFKIPATLDEWGALALGAVFVWLGVKAEQTK